MEMPELEPPAAGLPAGVLADEAIEPAFHAACQREISAIDRQHERIVEDRAIEPVRHDQIDAVGISMRVGALGPFVDPGEAMHAAARSIWRSDVATVVDCSRSSAAFRR